MLHSVLYQVAELILENYPLRTIAQRTLSQPWVNKLIARHPKVNLKNGKVLDTFRCTACMRSNLVPWFALYDSLNSYDAQISFFFDLLISILFYFRQSHFISQSVGIDIA